MSITSASPTQSFLSPQGAALKLKIAVIAGSAVGAAAFVVIFLFAFLYLCSIRRRQSAAPPPASASTSPEIIEVNSRLLPRQGFRATALSLPFDLTSHTSSRNEKTRRNASIVQPDISPTSTTPFENITAEVSATSTDRLRNLHLHSHTAAELDRIRALEHALEISNMQINETVTSLRVEMQWLRDHPQSGLFGEVYDVPPSYPGRSSTSTDSLVSVL